MIPELFNKQKSQYLMLDPEGCTEFVLMGGRCLVIDMVLNVIIHLCSDCST